MLSSSTSLVDSPQSVAKSLFDPPSFLAFEVSKEDPFQIPLELLKEIFANMPILGENWYAPILVNKKWKLLFKEIHPLMLLKSGKAPLLANPISFYIKDKEELFQIERILKSSISTLFLCQEGSDAEIFLLQNLCLFTFDTSISSTNPKIIKFCELCKELRIRFYDPSKNLSSLLRINKQFFQNSFLSSPTLKEAIRFHYLYLPYISKKLKTLEVCLTAIEQNGMVLQYVPEELKIAKMCLAAVQKDGGALQYVPEELKIAKMCLAAVQKVGRTLQYVPEKLKTVEVCLAAIQKDGKALQYVPKELKTPELCLTAVQQDGMALQYVSVNLKTIELCLIAIQQDGRALQYVPINLKTVELCLIAVQQDGRALQYVPEKIRALVRQLITV